MNRTSTQVAGLTIKAWVIERRAAVGVMPIVLVHGLGVSSRYLLPTAQGLCHQYRVYVPDLPGFGWRSKGRNTLNVSQLADLLGAWMDANGLAQAVFLGHSFGCQIIVELTVRHSDQITHAILVGPTMDARARTLAKQLWRVLCDTPHERITLPPLVLPAVVLEQSRLIVGAPSLEDDAVSLRSP